LKRFVLNPVFATLYVSTPSYNEKLSGLSISNPAGWILDQGQAISPACSSSDDCTSLRFTTADFPKRFPFPYVCLTTTKSYLASNRETIKRIVMALIEGTHFFKTRKEESKRILAKYSRQNNEAYLESSYNGNAPLFERVPLVTREGMEVQVKEALARKQSARLRIEDLIDNSIVLQLEKKGFIDRIYKQ